MTEGLYLHIPFCQKRCYYCDFNTYEGLTDLVPAYVDALAADMDLCAGQGLRGPLRSVFFGGGTPSVLEGAMVARLLVKAEALFGFQPGIEITLEANPGTVTLAKLQAYRQAGVNRLSMGFQARQDHHLKSLGRIHQAADSAEAFGMARAAGFKNLSLDLMFGLPGQTAEEWRESLEWGMDLEPEHLSFYGLTIEKGTRFFSLHQAGRLSLPSDEDQAAMYEEGIQTLEARGLEQYEISNFARPGRRSLHNQLYWQNLQTLGIGAGAWSFIEGRRFSRAASPQGYVQAIADGRIPVHEEERLAAPQARGEAAYLGLRLLDGISLPEWKERTGRDWFEDFGSQTEKLRGQGLLCLESGRLRLTRRALPLANEVFCEFLG